MKQQKISAALSKSLIGALAASGCYVLISSNLGIAQTLPPLYADDPVELVASESIAAFPVNTFLESVVVAADGTLYVSSHEDGIVIRIAPDGTRSLYAAIEGKATGLALAPDGSLLLTGWNRDQVSVVFRIEPDGTVTTLATLPDAQFLNGITPISGDRYLIADSYRGAIWLLDVAQQTAEIWLEHPLLARRTADSPTPAVNGLKFFNGTLYASNTDQQTVLQIPVNEQGEPETPEVFLSQANIDDFAFDIDGNLYGATHVFNSVVKVTPDGAITTIAQAEQGVTGSTAIAFGRTESDRTNLYVVTNGGMFLPPPTGVVPAEVVRLDVGNTGLPLN